MAKIRAVLLQLSSLICHKRVMTTHLIYMKSTSFCDEISFVVFNRLCTRGTCYAHIKKAYRRFFVLVPSTQ
jgi:hypothetical protein